MPGKIVKKTLNTRCVLLVMSFILQLFTALPAGADSLQAKVDELLSESQYKEAIRLLNQAAAATDNVSTRQKVLIRQGDVYYYYLEDYNSALQSYKNAYDTSPKTKLAANVLYRRGIIYMDKLKDKDSAVKEFEIILADFPEYHKRAELKQLLKGTLSRAYKVELIQRKNYWKFFICLLDAMIIFFWKVIHEYVSHKKVFKIMVDVCVTIMVIMNIAIWWFVIHAQAQLDMLSLGIIK